MALAKSRRARREEGGSPDRESTPIPEQTRCRTLAEETVDLVRDVLAREADRQERGLEREEIELLTDDIKARMEQRQFQAFLKRARNHCIQVARRSDWTAQRERVLERALVKRFSHLFPDTQDESPEPVTLPRTCLPGILQGIRLLVGSEVFERHQRLARERFHELPYTTSEERWDHAYQDPDINRIVLDVIMRSVPAFENPDSRFEWLAHLVERNLGTSEGGPPPFGPGQYFALLRSLFAEPGRLMAKGEGQEWMRERYGGKLVESLSALLHQLQS